ncbi:MAG: hypothetical protein ACR2N1_23285 [Rubripirellula sp.]
MNSTKAPPIENQTSEPERTWPLDVFIAAFAGLVLYLAVTELRFDDPRWMLNAWTYTIAVPVLALSMAFFSHGFVSRYVRRTIQLGVLFSLFVHLLLMMLAINVIIFSRYFPEAFSGVKQQRSPVRRTVPEHLFQTPTKTATAPDWSKPVDAETASPVTPLEERQLPPVEKTAPRLEIPKTREPQPESLQEFLMKRRKPNDSKPQPTDSPAKLARQRYADTQPAAWSTQTPTAPTVPVQPTTAATPVEQQVTAQPRSRPTSRSTAPSTASVELEFNKPQETSIAGARSRSTSLPTVGQTNQQQPRKRATPTRNLEPAGSAPTTQVVAVAKQSQSAERVVGPGDFSVTRQNRSRGVNLTVSQSTTSDLPSTSGSQAATSAARNTTSANSGIPTIDTGSAQRAPGRTRRVTTGFGMAATGPPTAPKTSIGNASLSATAPSDSIGDRNSDGTPMERISRPTRGAASAKIASAGGPNLDVMLDEGPAGIATVAEGRAGILPSDTTPEITVVDFSRGKRPRRTLGGPATPFGTKVASVESFNRRVMRTKGGTPATTTGKVGPQTEEAIEIGLSYLANTQNEDGSWSLQGHGERVLLQSNTAATGLCLLAFQGAGYTHRQHQYASTISRGIEYLMNRQQDNGDLYVSEDAISNRNVAFYSHGIAALAMCEAYGMTQDPELREPAQRCLDYIVSTQHNERGGWRYTAQVSSDTSVTGWMMMALKSGQLSGLEVPEKTYQGIQRWLGLSQVPQQPDRYRYNPFAPDTPTQRHGRMATPTMTSVGMLMRMYSGWRRDNESMKSAAEYLLEYPPQIGSVQSPQKDTYYWYYATQVMFHMGGDYWDRWNKALNPILIQSQIKDGVNAGSWDPAGAIPDRWSAHAGRLYVTTMNLLNLEVYYRHLPIYEETAE